MRLLISRFLSLVWASTSDWFADAAPYAARSIPRLGVTHLEDTLSHLDSFAAHLTSRRRGMLCSLWGLGFLWLGFGGLSGLLGDLVVYLWLSLLVNSNNADFGGAVYQRR